MKFKSLILCAALSMTFGAQAQVTGDVFRSTDTDGNTTDRSSVIIPLNKDLRLEYGNVRYRNNSASYSANELKANINLKRDDYSVNGVFGVASMGSKVYATGDVTATKHLNDNVSINAGTYAGIVDSEQGLINGTTVIGATVGAEYQNAIGGVVGSARAARFSNNNTQTGIYGKAYVNIVDGVNVYLATKQYGNSRPNNGDYFSPEDYKRYVIGLGFRHKFSDVTVSGYYERGIAKIDNTSSKVYAWKISADVPINKKWSSGVTAGYDTSNNSNYKYRYLQVHLTYVF